MAVNNNNDTYSVFLIRYEGKCNSTKQRWNQAQGGHHSDSTSKHEQVELEAEGQAAGSLGFKLSLGSGLA